MTADSDHTHSIAITGGTLTMGYVSGEFLKKLSPDEYAVLKDDGQYLYPLYDIRHVALAAFIDGSALPEERKRELYTQLVETSPLIQELLLAKKEGGGEALETELDRRLSDIAVTIEPGLTVHAVLEGYGLDESRVSKPYFIDSINYDETTHDEKLYTEARNALLGKKDQTFFVIGGTDSLTMYAGKLTRRLIDEGIISEETGNKVIFLSAMKSFGYAPEGIRETPKSVKAQWRMDNRPFTRLPEPPPEPHIDYHPQYIGRLFRKAMELGKPAKADEPSVPPGGYLFCPASEDCGISGLHDARESMKVYYKHVEPFRSKSRYVAEVFDLSDYPLLKPNPKYQPTYKTTGSPDQKIEHVSIAPPLINGNSTISILSYLLKMRDYPVVIVGGLPAGMKGITPLPDFPGDRSRLSGEPSMTDLMFNMIDEVHRATFDVIRERAERGVPTYYINPDIYDVTAAEVHPLLDEKDWRRSLFIHEAQKAGAVVLSGATTIGLYHDIQLQLGKLTHVEGLEKIKQAGGKPELALKKDVSDIQAKVPMLDNLPIGIEYVPDRPAFEAGFRAAAEGAKDVVINALPGGIVPGYIEPLVREYAKDHTIIAGYEYNSAYRLHAQRTGRLENTPRPSYEWAAHSMPMSDYAPATAFSQAGGHDCGVWWTPTEIMYRLPYQKHERPPRGGTPGAAVGAVR